MKKSFILTGLMALSITFQVAFAQASKQETLKVWGNCGMCKKTIESAALKGGALTAEWNKDSKMLTFTHNDNATAVNAVQTAVAAAGYDTRDVMGDDEAYNKLPGCCQYDRKNASSEKMDAKSESCSKDGCKKCKKKGGDMDCCKDGKCEKHKKG